MKTSFLFHFYREKSNKQYYQKVINILTYLIYCFTNTCGTMYKKCQNVFKCVGKNNYFWEEIF